MYCKIFNENKQRLTGKQIPNIVNFFRENLCKCCNFGKLTKTDRGLTAANVGMLSFMFVILTSTVVKEESDGDPLSRAMIRI